MSANPEILQPSTGSEIREAAGIFDSIDQLDAAVRDLESSSFPRDAISILGSKDDIEKKYGTANMLSQHMEDSDDAPRQAPSRPEEHTIGSTALIGCAAYIGIMASLLAAPVLTIPATIAAVVLGGGGGAAIGGAVFEGLRHRMKANAQFHLEHGGLLLWVRTLNADQEQLAKDILSSNGARDIKIHNYS